MPILVNGQAQSLSSVNQDKSSNTSDGVTRLSETLLKDGKDGNIGKNLAPVIGLPRPMPIKQQEIVVSEHNDDYEKRTCIVVYETAEATTTAPGEKLPLWIYMLRSKREGLNHQVRYFRTDLTGKLDKSLLTRAKIDMNGKAVRGSGVKTDLDIDSPEVRKAFQTEIDFWLKDWLKTQGKVPAKKA